MKQINLTVKIDKEYSNVVKATNAIAPWDEKQDDLAIKLAYLAPFFNMTLLPLASQAIQALGKRVIGGPVKVDEDGKPVTASKTQAYTVTLGIGTEVNYSDKNVAEVALRIELQSDNKLNREGLLADATELADRARPALLAMLQANGICPPPPPILSPEQAEALMVAQDAARRADVLVRHMQALRGACEYYSEQEAALKVEFEKADSADMELLRQAGADLTTAKAALEIRAASAAQALVREFPTAQVVAEDAIPAADPTDDNEQ